MVFPIDVEPPDGDAQMKRPSAGTTTLSSSWYDASNPAPPLPGWGLTRTHAGPSPLRQSSRNPRPPSLSAQLGRTSACTSACSHPGATVHSAGGKMRTRLLRGRTASADARLRPDGHERRMISSFPSTRTRPADKVATECPDTRMESGVGFGDGQCA